MKKILFFLFSIFSFFTLQAQIPRAAAQPKITGKITATIIDSISKQPVDFATVSLVLLKDGKPVNGAVTDNKGKISIQDVAPNDYKLMVGFMGYQNKSIKVSTTLSKPDQNLGDILLSPSSNALNEVQIVGEKAVIENKIDRMVYNAEADGTNAGGDATDVLRKVPMLSVDAEGNLQMRGSAVRVLINGKPSGTMANSVADALKMIPAEQIKNVEVITSPSAKYDAEGSGGIVNIITKKSNAQGLSGSVNLAAGTRHNNGGFNLTAKTGRLSVNTALGANYSYPQNTSIFINQKNNYNGINTEILQEGFSKWTRDGYNGSLGVDYDINAYNNISSNIKLNRFYNGGPGETKNYINQVLALNENNMDMAFNNMDWNVDYRKTSTTAGEEFSVSGQMSIGRNTSDFFNKLSYPDGTIAPLISEDSNVGKNKEYTAQMDYVYPFSKNTIFEVGVKGIFRNILSEYGNKAAQNFDYTQDVASAYSTISFNFNPTLKFKGGVRAEYTNINFLTAEQTKYKNDYFNLFPSLILSQNLNAMTSVKLSYNRRVQRPSLFYLNPFRNESNQFNIMQGNPYLNPELSDNFELGYSTFIKGSVINASVFYRRTGGIIESFISPLQENGVNKTLTSYINVGTSNSLGANIFASYNPLPKWTVMGNFGLNTYEVKNETTKVNTGTLYNYNAFLRSALRFGTGYNAEMFAVYTSGSRTFQGKTDAMVFYGASLKKDILNKKGTIGINVLNPFSRDLNINTEHQSENSYALQKMAYPIRSFGLNFSYSFGKLKFTERSRIKNDDVKKEQNQQQGGQGGNMGGI